MTWKNALSPIGLSILSVLVITLSAMVLKLEEKTDTDASATTFSAVLLAVGIVALISSIWVTIVRWRKDDEYIDPLATESDKVDGNCCYMFMTFTISIIVVALSSLIINRSLRSKPDDDSSAYIFAAIVLAVGLSVTIGSGVSLVRWGMRKYRA